MNYFKKPKMKPCSALTGTKSLQVQTTRYFCRIRWSPCWIRSQSHKDRDVSSVIDSCCGLLWHWYLTYHISDQLKINLYVGLYRCFLLDANDSRRRHQRQPCCCHSSTNLSTVPRSTPATATCFFVFTMFTVLPLVGVVGLGLGVAKWCCGSRGKAEWRPFKVSINRSNVRSVTGMICIKPATSTKKTWSDQQEVRLDLTLEAEQVVH